MEKIVAEKMAREIIKSIVDMLSQKRYEEITTIAEMDRLTVDDVKEITDGYLELNGFTHIDCFDTECNFHPSYEYHQIEFYHYNNGGGFRVNYDLTTDKELNDLTLQMEFIFDIGNILKAKFLDLHVM